jgi:TP901 family phage tail tape measure protein
MVHLTRTIRTMEVGSREYNREMSRIRHLNAIIANHNRQLRTTQINLTSLSGLTNTIRRQWYGIMASVGAFTGLAFATRRASQEYAEFDDKMADVMKVTGLTRDEVRELNRELEKLDTRTAQESLLNLAWVAGKLGITAQEEIMDFVHAADKIAVALAADLGGNVEDAIREVGKMADIFELREIYGIGDAMLRLGSTINELGMASTAQESFLINFASRVGGIAPTAGVSAQNVLGLAATLDQLGQRAESSSTAYSRVMTTMAKDTETMARLAGMSVAEYEKLFREDANEAMLRLFESIGKSEGGFQALISALGEAGLEGQRATQVLGVLIRNTETLREQQALANRAFEDGSSVVDEFNIKNNTAQAIIDKKQKALGILRRELGERLLPVYMGALSTQERFMKGLVTVVEWVYENRRVLISLTSALIAFQVVLKTTIALQRTQIFVGTGMRAVQLQLIRGYSLLTGNITRAAAAQRMFNTLQLKSPWGVIIGGIVAIGVAIWQYRKRVTEVVGDVNKVYQQANQEYNQQAANVTRLVSIIEDERLSNEKRIEAIKELRKIMPGYNGMLDKEGKLIEHNTDNIRNYLEQLRAKIRMKALEDEIYALTVKQVEAEDELSRAREAHTEAIMNNDYGDGSAGDILVADMELSRAQAELDRINSAIKKLIDSRVKKTPPPGSAGGGGGGGGDDDDFDGGGVGDGLFDRRETVEKQLLQQEFLAGKLLGGWEEYQEKLKEIEYRFMQERLKGQKEDSDEWLKLRGQIYDREIEMLRQNNKREEELEKTAALDDPIAIERMAYQERLQQRGLFYKNFQQMDELEQAAAIALAEQHQANLDKIDADTIKAEIDRREAAHQLALQQVQIQHQKQLDETLTFEQAKAALAEFMSEQELQKIGNIQQARAALQKQHAEIEREEAYKHLRDMVKMLETLMQTGQWEGMILADDVFSDQEKQIIIENLREVYKAMAALKPDGKFVAHTLRGMQMDVFGFTQDDWDNLFENLKNGVIEVQEIQMALTALGNMWYDINQVISNSEKRKLQEFEKNNQTQQDILQQRLDAGLISHEFYTNQQQKLEADLERKRAQQARNQARREKNVALMQAIVNTAAAVTKALPNILLAAIVAAAGALQVGAIASTPLPEIPGAQHGGYLDVVRSQDKKKFRAGFSPDKRGWITGPTIITGEQGYEYVIPEEGVKNQKLRPIIDMIEMARIGGSLPTLDPSAVGVMQSIPGRQVGGSIGRDTNYSRSSAEGISDSADISRLIEHTHKLLQKNEKAVNKLLKQLDDPIIATVALTGRHGLNEATEKYESLKKNVYL